MGFLDKTRGTLFFDFAKILQAKAPSAFLIENVRGLANHDKGNTLKVILDTIRNIGYHCRYKILDAKDFGVPQKRARIFIIGFRSEDAYEFEFPKGIPLKATLSDCLESGVSEDHYLSRVYLAGLERHRRIQESKGRGFGYEILDPSGTSNALVCGGMGRERNLVVDHNLPSPYLENRNERHVRMLTARECARLQGFPDSFVIPVSKADAYRQFGNSVAIPVIEAIAKGIGEFLGRIKAGD
jgi:DNA (cytosine-5)-methyltransferase 1